MSEVFLKGHPVKIYSALPQLGSQAPEFTLTQTDLSPYHLKEATNNTLVLNIFPSLDTAVCANSVRKFNEKMAGHHHVKVLCISADLPFAHKRFCTAEGIENVIPLSSFRNPEFGQAYGLTIQDGPLAGLLSRAVVVIHDQKVVYTQQVSEITDEPDYNAVFARLDSL